MAAKKKRKLPPPWGKVLFEVVEAHLSARLKALLAPLGRPPTPFELTSFEDHLKDGRKQMSRHLMKLIPEAEEHYEKAHGSEPCEEGEKCVGRHVALMATSIQRAKMSKRQKREQVDLARSIVERFLNEGNN